jgi:hypothetical protein
MSKAKMLYARELISEKRYDEARAILNDVDHPKAREWLSRLDQIAPSMQPHRKRLRLPRKRTILLATIVGSVVCYAATLSTTPPSPSSLAPTRIPISECSGSQYVDCLRNQLTAAVQQVGGRITSSGNDRYSDGRLEYWIDVRLSQSNNYATARNVMERALRVYAGAIPSENAGSFVVTVMWSRDGQSCSDNAGMGFRTMQRINWGSVSQQGIFSAINRNNYGDAGDYFGDMGFAPDTSILPECNR